MELAGPRVGPGRRLRSFRLPATQAAPPGASPAPPFLGRRISDLPGRRRGKGGLSSFTAAPPSPPAPPPPPPFAPTPDELRVPRVPLKDPRRMQRFTETVALILNGLIDAGHIRQTAAGDWVLNPPASGSGASGTFGSP